MKPVIFAFLLSASLSLGGDLISFQKLPTSDSIHVMFTSTGCFHSVTYEFVFQRGTTMTAKITQIEHRWNETQKRQEEAKRIVLGTVKLSEIEISGLDNLFTFYRSKSPGECTTVDSITVTQKNGDTAKATESFTDETGETYDRKDLMLFPSIAAKLNPKTK